MADNLTIAYAVKVSQLTSVYDAIESGKVRTSLERAVRNYLSRHWSGRGAISHINWTVGNAVTVPRRGDIVTGARHLADRYANVMNCYTGYLYEEYLAWHIYMEDCQIKAWPVWHKPIGRTNGFFIGRDPAAILTDYYERSSEKVFRALEQNRARWRECWKRRKEGEE